MWETRDRSVVTSSVIPSAKYCWSGSLLRLVKGSTTIDRRGATRGCEIAVGPTPTAVGVGVFLYALLPEILERVGQLVANVVAYRPRDADAAGLGERFQPRRDVDAVAEDVVTIGDDVPDVDADAKPDAPLAGRLGFAVDHPTLHLGGTAHRIDDARKLHEQAVAGGFDDAAAVLLDLRVARCRRTALWRSWVPSSSAP